MILMLAAGSKTEEDIENEISLVVGTRKRSSKPVMVITPATRLQKTRLVRKVRKKLQEGGVPVFSSLERGAKALRNAVEYYQLKDAINNEK